MKQETVEETKIELDNIPIGEDVPQVAAQPVVVEDYNIEIVSIKEKEHNKLVLKVKHPDMNEPIEISAAKYEGIGDKLKTGGLWVKLDSKGSLPFKSAVACMLRHLRIGFIKDLKGKVLQTVIDDKGYLAVKAY